MKIPPVSFHPSGSSRLKARSFGSQTRRINSRGGFSASAAVDGLEAAVETGDSPARLGMEVVRRQPEIATARGRVGFIGSEGNVTERNPDGKPDAPANRLMP
ncbi:MAG: hypothetical protein ACYDC1_18225 [Limisphaerales bacterium]